MVSGLWFSLGFTVLGSWVSWLSSGWLLGLQLFGFSRNYHKEPKSYTFRGSEVSQGIAAVGFSDILSQVVSVEVGAGVGQAFRVLVLGLQVSIWYAYNSVENVPGFRV